MLTFSRLSLARYFLLASFLILLTGMLLIGKWVGEQIEHGVVQRTSALTALYVGSLVGHHLPPFAQTAQLGPDEQRPLDMLFTNSALSKEIVAVKLWAQDGRIVYSTDRSLVGRVFPVTPDLAVAFAGRVRTEIVTPDRAGTNQPALPARLMRTYAPVYSNGVYMDYEGVIDEIEPTTVHTDGVNMIIAAAEFDQTMEGLDLEVSAAQGASWAVVGMATLIMYLLLAGLVGRASNIISRQQRELQGQVHQLTELVEQNAQLNNRVHRAAARSTALNEQFLHRLSADLHDGPCQDLGFALLRIETLADSPRSANRAAPNGKVTDRDHHTIQTALQSALAELRTISTGLWLPALEPLTPREVAERAVRDYESKTGVGVTLSVADTPPLTATDVPLSVKIALYRVLQEALINGFRHASGADQHVKLWISDGNLCAQITDAGAGFDTQAVIQNGHLGLPSMRERVELLGGAFEVHSTPGRGTMVQTKLPLKLPEDEHG